MRVAALAGAITICVAARTYVQAGPTPSSDLLKGESESASVDAARNNDVLSDPVALPMLSAPVDSGTTSAPQMAGSDPQPVLPLSGNSLDSALGAGVWHPGLEEARLLAAPIAVSSDVSPNDAANRNPIIPLPSAGWTGMMMLALLAAFRFFKNFRRILT